VDTGERMSGSRPNGSWQLTRSGGFSGLLRRWVNAPYMSLRENMLRLSGFALVLAVWAAVTARWLLLLCSVPALMLFVAVGLRSQHRAEVTGRVEEERLEREEARSRRAAWPTWKRRLFYVSISAVVLAVLAWDVWTDFR
jgi:hypothetical protein